MNFNINEITFSDMYKILLGTVVPRPIAWISTMNKKRENNLAPFSFYNVASSSPPMLCVSIGPGEGEREGTMKDTLSNIVETQEFVLNVVNYPLTAAMETSSGEYHPEVDEFREVGVTPGPCVIVKVPRVLESPINIECQLERVIPLGDDHLVIGKMVYMHIRDEIYHHGKIDLKQLQPVGRLTNQYILANRGFTI